MPASPADGEIPVTPLTCHILLALADGPLHGYAIIKQIGERTGGSLRPATGTMYLALGRLREEGLIAEAPSAGGDNRRRSYELTSRGRVVLGAEVRRMARLVADAVAKDVVGTDVLEHGK